MKKTGRCPKCDCARIAHFSQVMDEADGNRSRNIGFRYGGSFLGLRTMLAAGEVEAFVCTGCGYFEEHVKSPETMKWEEMVGLQWWKPAS